MKIKHTDILIEEDNPFVNCKLNRKPFANILTSIVDLYETGFVLAINNEWGTGKTTFVKMWKQQLQNNGYRTLYFNAWENDFDKNPLIAILSELKNLTTSENEKLFRSVVQKGAIIAKNIIPAVATAMINKYVDTEIIKSALEEGTKGITEIFTNELDEYNNKKESVKEFRKLLEDFVKQTNNGKPIVFMIDELDRCRPHYAVELLEEIKHFFSVEGIVFVLSIDKTQLCHAIRGFYGNADINSEEYLRRFIDLEYSIPAPSVEDFTNYLYDYYSFDDFFRDKERVRYSDFSYDKEAFKKIATVLCSNNYITLRMQEKIFATIRLIIKSFAQNSRIFPDTLFILSFIKTVKPVLYRTIKEQKILVQELSDEFFNLVPMHVIASDKYISDGLLYMECQLLFLYNKKREINKEEIFIQNEEGNYVSIISPKMEKYCDHRTFAECWDSVSRDHSIAYQGLKYLLERIDLTQDFRI